MKKHILLYCLLSMFHMAGLLPSLADGQVDGVIGREYGASKSLDTDNDALCDGTAARGDMIDFHAFSAPADGVDGEWHFAFVIDSSFPLNATTGDFFGQEGTDTVTYLIGIDLDCDDSPRVDMNASTPWRRFFGWGVDYFIGIYPSGADTLQGMLYDHNKNFITMVDVTTRLVGFRRHVEFKLDKDNGAIPAELKSNESICLLLTSTYNQDGSDFDGGRVIDALGSDAQDSACEDVYVTFNGFDVVDTQASSKMFGRPTDPGVNDRQSTSLPRRDYLVSLDSGTDCDVENFGLFIDGFADPEYTHLVEAMFASPYQGGSMDESDFSGESAAKRYHYESFGDQVGTLAGPRGADIRQVYAHADTNYLYLLVSGPDALGWANEPDLSSLFIALDVPWKTSDTDVGGIQEELPNAPAGRWVNFRGWNPDYAIEVYWKNGAILWNADNFWQNASGFQFVGDGGNQDTRSAAIDRYYGRTWFQINNEWFPGYEFSIPWSDLGGVPTPDSSIKVGVYTTGDENIGNLGLSNWDTFDQAPGIGQGGNGFGQHERIGDEPKDSDLFFPPSNSDATPYVGRTDGFEQFIGLPGNFWKPASDSYNFATPFLGGEMDFAGSDVDTIEEYYEFAVEADIFTCKYCDLTLSCPDDFIAECGSVLADLTASVFVQASLDCGNVTVTQSPEAGTVLVNTGSLSVTITATADSGETTECTVNVIVNDGKAPVLFNLPDDQVVECDAIPLPPQVTADDECEGPVNVDFTENFSTGSCPGVITRTWTATDSAGNSTSATRTVTFDDTAPPVLIGVPNDLLLSCEDNIPQPPTVTADDNCSHPPVQFSETNRMGCTQQVIRVWSAVDGCGNITAETQTITIVDAQAPSLTCPSNVVIDCGNSTHPSNTGYAAATDLCSQATVTWQDEQSDETCPLVITRTWTAEDDCGNRTQCVQIITVIDDEPPVWTNTVSDLELECGDSIHPDDTGRLGAADICSIPEVTYQDTETNVCDSSYTFTIEQGKKDGFGYSTMHEATKCKSTIDGKKFFKCGGAKWSVDGILHAEKLSPLSYQLDGQLIIEDLPDALVSATFDFSVAEGELIGTMDYTFGDESGTFYFYNYTFQGPANGLNNGEIMLWGNNWDNGSMTRGEFIAAGGIPRGMDIGGVLECSGCETQIERVWTAEDDCGNSIMATQQIRIVDTQAPVINCPPDMTATSAHVSVTGEATAQDCHDVTIRYEDRETCIQRADAALKITNPNATAHAFYLPGISKHFHFVDGGAYAISLDGSVHLTGIIAIPGEPNKRWSVDVSFSGLVEPGDADYPPSGSPKKELPSSYYAENGGPIDTDTWSYLTSFSGTLTGEGDYAGAEITLVTTGPAYQFGFGANNKNLNYGGSGWFIAQVTQQPTSGDTLPTNNIQGDINIDITEDCVRREIARTWSATDDCGHTSTCTQQIIVEQSQQPVGQ